MRLLPSMIIMSCVTVCCLSASSTKFRMEKVNYIYDKAVQKIADKQRIIKLEGELSGFDRLLQDGKERRESGKIDKEDQSTVDRKLRLLLEKYDLDQVLDAFEKKQEKRSPSSASKDLNDVVFSDEKLQKLWSAARTQKFAKDEMEELHKELLELEKKQAELHDALHDLSKTPNENHVDAGHDSHIHIETKNKRAKEANRAVVEHYDELHKKVLNQEFTPFTNTKVKKLWQEAQRSANFTSYDLDVIREELIHFDKQLTKLDAHKDELSRMADPSKKEAKSTYDHLENGELEAKHERLDRKLKKLEKYLVTKIKHSEL